MAPLEATPRVRESATATLGEVDMAETTKVVAKMRDRAGKGGARSSRRDGLIPAVIYGDKQPPMMIAVEPKSVERENFITLLSCHDM